MNWKCNILYFLFRSPRPLLQLPLIRAWFWGFSALRFIFNNKKHSIAEKCFCVIIHLHAKAPYSQFFRALAESEETA